jgi:phosphoserine phosphatase RsbU/P
MRQGKVIAELTCAVSLPFGLGSSCEQVSTEQLEPGDSVLFFTDGVSEGRSPTGELFGTERLAQLWEERSVAPQATGDDAAGNGQGGMWFQRRATAR